MSLLHLLSYVGIVAAAAFVILSLASGLLWISELIEEHSRAAKAVGIRAVYAIILLHILLYFTDSLPVLHTLFSITAHLVYLQNFSHTWPFISLASPAFLASCILAILNHFAWFFYFSRVSREVQAMRSQRVFRGNVHAHGSGGGVTAPGFQDIATFFALCVWFVPLFLFLSLSANDNALPMSANGFDSPTRANAPSRVISTSRSSLFKSILDLFPFLRRRRDRTDGILVTHTPSHSAPSTPRTSYSGQNPYTAASATSRTSFETAYPLSSPGPSPSLRPPPKRTSTGPASAHSSSFLGSPRTPDEGWTVVGGQNVRSTATSASSSSSTTTTSLFVSRSTSEEMPVRRRTVAE